MRIFIHIYIYIYIYIYIRPVVLTVGGRSRLGGLNRGPVGLLVLLGGRGRHSNVVDLVVVVDADDLCSRSCSGRRTRRCSRSCILQVGDSLRGLAIRHPHHHCVHADPYEARPSTGRRPACHRCLGTCIPDIYIYIYIYIYIILV